MHLDSIAAAEMRELLIKTVSAFTAKKSWSPTAVQVLATPNVQEAEWIAGKVADEEFFAPTVEHGREDARTRHCALAELFERMKTFAFLEGNRARSPRTRRRALGCFFTSECSSTPFNRSS